LTCDDPFKIHTNLAKATKNSRDSGQFVDRRALQVAIPAKIGMIVRIIVIVS